MCLGIPGRIMAIGEDLRAEIELGGIRREADLTLVPEARVGEYVIVHVGYAIQRIDEVAAEETLELLRQMALAEDEARR